MHAFVVLACLLTVTAVLAGCTNSDLGPEDHVMVTARPQEAGVPIIALPTGATINYTSYDGRRFAYQHSGSSQYSDASTQLLDRITNQQGFIRDRSFKDYFYYQPSVINQNDFTAPFDGSFVVKATYRTHNPSAFSEPGGFRERTATRAFMICPFGTSQCSGGGRAAPSDSPTGGPTGGTVAEASPAAGGTAGKMLSCTPDREGNSPCSGSGGGGGGGGGGYTPPSYLQHRVHTASMGPFFAASNLGSSVSRGEIEDVLESLNPDQLDGIADIMREAYGQDVYDYLQVPEDAITLAARGSASAGADTSPFLSLMAPLDAADRSALGVERIALDRLLRVRDRYRAARASEAALARSAAPADGQPGATTQAGKTGGQADVVSAAVWPNPVSTRLNIRVHGEQATTVSIYDARGRLVAQVPISARSQDQTVGWDLRAGSGQRVAAGVYQVVVTAGGVRHASTVTIL